MAYRRLTEAFPHEGHRNHSGAVPGIMSSYINACMKWHVPQDVDLILVGFVEVKLVGVEWKKEVSHLPERRCCGKPVRTSHCWALWLLHLLAPDNQNLQWRPFMAARQLRDGPSLRLCPQRGRLSLRAAEVRCCWHVSPSTGGVQCE